MVCSDQLAFAEIFLEPVLLEERLLWNTVNPYLLKWRGYDVKWLIFLTKEIALYCFLLAFPLSLSLLLTSLFWREVVAMGYKAFQESHGSSVFLEE